MATVAVIVKGRLNLQKKKRNVLAWGKKKTFL